jgi:uncharacterized protein YbaP (TraB family)
MRTKSLLPLALLAMLSPALAAVAPATAKAPPVPLLWKVSDADNSLYLLGSFHLLRKDDYPLSPDVDAAFADAESVLLEMAPGDMASPTLAMDMGRAALRTDGSTLDGTLPPETSRKLRDWFERKGTSLLAAGMTPQSLQQFEPWFVGLAVSMAGMGETGLDPALGLDRHLGAAAIAAGKPAGGLETPAQQIAFLDGMDAEEQLQFLDEALTDSLEGDTEVEALHAAWRAGDADALWTIMAADMREAYPKLYAHINVARNDAWLPLLEQRLDAPGSDDTLVVVGAMHLLGSDGVVEKLRGRGYVVQRVCSACANGGGR